MGDELAAASHGFPSCAGSESPVEAWRLAVIHVARRAIDGPDLKHQLTVLGLIPDDGSGS